MTSSARSMKVDNVNRLIEAVRSWDAFDMEKMLRVASDIAGYEPETCPWRIASLRPNSWV